MNSPLYNIPKLLCVSFLIILYECSQPQSDIQVKTFQVDDKGWGYDIYMKNKLYIHQPHIPAVSGNNAFKNQADAEKTGNLVVNKIRNNIMPPSVTVKELDSLKVL